MSIKSDNFMVNLVSGLNDTADELKAQSERKQAVAMARQKFDQDMEMGKIEKQKAELDLKQKKMSGDLDEYGYKIAKMSLDQMFNAGKQQADINSEILDHTEHAENSKLDYLAQKFQGQHNDLQAAMSDPAISMFPGMDGVDASYSQKVGPFTFTNKDTKPKIEDRKVLGALQSGGFYRKDAQGDYGVQEFANEKEARIYAANNLGENWEKRYPKAVDYIKGHFPEASAPEPTTTPKTKKSPGFLENTGKAIGKIFGGQEKVLITRPDGKQGYIPKENLEEALSRGAKLAQ